MVSVYRKAGAGSSSPCDVVLEWARQADSGPFSSEGEDLEGSLTAIFIFGCIIQDDI